MDYTFLTDYSFLLCSSEKLSETFGCFKGFDMPVAPQKKLSHLNQTIIFSAERGADVLAGNRAFLGAQNASGGSVQVEQDQLQVGIWLPCTGSCYGWGMSLRMAPPGAVPADGQHEEGLFPFVTVGISHVAASGAASAFLPVPEEPGSTFRTSWYWDVYQDVPLSCG